jgi:hypothetical protein
MMSRWLQRLLISLLASTSFLPLSSLVRLGSEAGNSTPKALVATGAAAVGTGLLAKSLIKESNVASQAAQSIAKQIPSIIEQSPGASQTARSIAKQIPSGRHNIEESLASPKNPIPSVPQMLLVGTIPSTRETSWVQLVDDFGTPVAEGSPIWNEYHQRTLRITEEVFQRISPAHLTSEQALDQALTTGSPLPSEIGISYDPASRKLKIRYPSALQGFSGEGAITAEVDVKRALIRLVQLGVIAGAGGILGSDRSKEDEMKPIVVSKNPIPSVPKMLLPYESSIRFIDN